MAIEAIRAERLAKLKRLEDAGMEAYPATTKQTHTVEQFLANHAALQAHAEVVTLAGRVMSIREHGGLVFADLFDGTGKTQGYIQKDALGDAAFELFESVVDTGDIVELSGVAFTTKRGMSSLQVQSWRMLAKSIQQIPDEWYGLKDEDERYRKRYIDLILNKETADRVRRRSKFWNTIRAYLLERGFIEVETPVLETTTGGAEAEPFKTHHNALDIDVYLRISAGELWQKRLMVAGLPKVFEIGRIFRNEGMSAEHLQDYTQIEFYEAYKDYEAGMVMLTDLYRTIADQVYGTRIFKIKNFEVDLGKEWVRYDFCTLMQDAYGFDPRDVQEKTDMLIELLRKEGIPVPEVPEAGRMVDLLWKKVRKTIAGPGFLINVPVYLEPLAKKSAKDPRVVERFQIMMAGSEVGKGFSELNDPIDQAERFAHQQALRDAGDSEAQMPDAEFVEALEYGMPPAFGFGISERLFSFLEGVSVREGQIFPLMRPRDAGTPKKEERKVAVAVVRKDGLEPWQILNTVGHLTAALGVREGKQLQYTDHVTTKDAHQIPLNIQHAIVLKEAATSVALEKLLEAAQQQKLQVTAFTRQMLETTNDKKILEQTKAMPISDVEFLGVLVFGPASAVDDLTKEFPRYS